MKTVAASMFIALCLTASVYCQTLDLKDQRVQQNFKLIIYDLAPYVAPVGTVFHEIHVAETGDVVHYISKNTTESPLINLVGIVFQMDLNSNSYACIQYREKIPGLVNPARNFISQTKWVKLYSQNKYPSKEEAIAACNSKQPIHAQAIVSNAAEEVEMLSRSDLVTEQP